MGNNRPDRKGVRRPLTAADIEALSADFDAPTADLLPSSPAGMAELVQARLKVSNPGDSFEVEAESTADAFVNANRSRKAPRTESAGVSRSVDNDGLVGAGTGLRTTDETGARIGAAKGGGVGLRPDVRARFESFFGTDLGDVRVHDDTRSDTLCRSISAEAFTSGRDVFFTRGGYSPGSAEGDHLLAHELTHVVQQNGSAPVSRRATPDVMRAGDEAPRLAKKTERDPTESLTSTAAGGVSTAAVLGSNIGGTFGKLDDVGGVMKVKEGVATDSLNLGGVDAAAAMQASGSFGLFDAVAQLFDSVTSLFNNWNGHSFDSAMNAGVNAVKSSLSTAQSSIQIAAASGAAIGAAVIPGLGLAIAVIDLVKQVLRAVDLYKAKTNATKKLDELTGTTALSPKGVDIKLSPEDEKLKEALTRLRSDANWEMVRTITRIVGDIVIIGGQIGTLAGGAGAIATLVGGAVLGIAAVTGKIQGWAEANSVQKSRAAQQADPDNHLLQIERLKVDTYYSACELINYSALAVSGETGEVDNSVVDLVKPFGIDAAWLSRYNEGGRTEAMLDSGAKIVCEKLGKSPNPTTFMQDVMKVVGALKTGLTWVATGVGYVLKFAGRALGFVAGLVLAALGVGVGILVHPLLGMPLIDSIGPVANGIAKGTDTMVDGVGNAANSVGAMIDASLGGFKNYFVDEGDIRLRAAQKFTPIIRTYFAEKKDNGTDVKADSLTSKIKDEYTNLSSIAKNKSPKDKPGYNNPAGAVSVIDSVIVDIIKATRPERVDLETVRVSKGKVTWQYLGGGLIKTKGLLAGIKNFFGGEKYEKV